MRLTHIPRLASFKEGEGLLYGSLPDGFCYATMQEREWNGGQKTKSLIMVIDQNSWMFPPREQGYAIDITMKPTAIPVTKKPFSKTKGHFISTAGAICIRVDDNLCTCHYPDGDVMMHRFNDDHEVYELDTTKVNIEE